MRTKLIHNIKPAKVDEQVQKHKKNILCYFYNPNKKILKFWMREKPFPYCGEKRYK